MMDKSENASLWRYVIILSKTLVLFVDAGMSKSFGVLIPVMVDRFESDYATVGMICSLPTTLMYLCCPIVIPLMQRFSKRHVAMSGGLLTGLCLVACAFINNTVLVGVCLALAGVGSSMSYMIGTQAINDYFPESFVLVSSVTCYGYTAGSMLLPIVTEKSLEAYGYPGAFLILGGIALNVVVSGATMRNAPPRKGLEELRECFEDRLDGSEEPREHSVEEKSLAKLKDVESSASEFKRVPSEQELRIPHSFKDGENKEQPQKLVKSPIFSGILNESQFLFSLPVCIIMMYLLYAWMLFLVPHTEELGIKPSKAIYLSTIGGVGGICGRLALTILLAKGVHKDKELIVQIVVSSVCASAFLLDFVGAAYVIRALLAFVQGFCLFFLDQITLFLIKYLLRDSENFDVAVAISSFADGIGATCSGYFTGYLYDVTHSFTKVFMIIGLIQVVMVGHLSVILILKRRSRAIKGSS